MTFPLDDILLGPATFGRLHRLDMVIGHTGEEPAFDRKYAVATANWQLTNPGSYSFRIYDRRTDPRGVMLNVPWLEASGGINPGSSAWAPERFPWIQQELAKSGPCPVSGCPGPYRNPTMHAGQISFTGRRADLDAGKAPPNYVTDAERLIDWYEAHPLRGSAPLVVIMHGHLQSNRSDWGAYMQSRLAPETEVAVPTRPVREGWKIPAGTEFWLGGPGLGESKKFGIAIELTSNGETLDGLWRRIEYHNTATEGEELWIKRSAITPIPGTRNPATGFGPPTLSTGYTQAQLDAAKAESLKTGKADIHAKAIVAAENHLTAIRGIK